MSHQNNTMPGPDAASLTTLDNTDLFLERLPDIAGGVLVDQVDSSRIVWIGHSRGGEGVVRAYDRMFDGTNVPDNFGIEDIVLISSIAPTNFLGASGADPHAVPYHLWTGSADDDVSGGPQLDLLQTFQLFERAESIHVGTVLQGAGHAAFHSGGGSLVAEGPCQIGRDLTHERMQAILLPLVRHFVDGEEGAFDWLWRSRESLRPVADDIVDADCAIASYELRGEPGTEPIDDFQTGTSTNLSSTGTPVTFTVQSVTESRLDDLNTNFTWTPVDPMNGLTRAGPGDTSRGVVFEWDQPAFYRFAVPPRLQDLTAFEYLSLRACQAPRHPLTMAEFGDVTFDVVLEDSGGIEARLPIDAYGGGVNEPYQRPGSGSGVGWAAEFETFRLRLDDFLVANPDLALGDVVAVRLDFAGPGSSSQGRLALDDLVLIP